MPPADAPHGTVALAEHQTAGRGRLGRIWVDEPGAGLALSVVLRPPPPVARWPELTLVAAEAVAGAIGEGATIKEPNDVLARGAQGGGDPGRGGRRTSSSGSASTSARARGPAPGFVDRDRLELLVEILDRPRAGLRALGRLGRPRPRGGHSPGGRAGPDGSRRGIHWDTAVKTSVLLTALLAATAAAPGLAAAPVATPRVLAITFNQEVDPVTAALADGELDRAHADHDAAAVILLDTPGGDEDSMRTIVQKELAAEPGGHSRDRLRLPGRRPGRLGGRLDLRGRRRARDGARDEHRLLDPDLLDRRRTSAATCAAR